MDLSGSEPVRAHLLHAFRGDDGPAHGPQTGFLLPGECVGGEAHFFEEAEIGFVAVSDISNDIFKKKKGRKMGESFETRSFRGK